MKHLSRVQELALVVAVVVADPIPLLLRVQDPPEDVVGGREEVTVVTTTSARAISIGHANQFMFLHCRSGVIRFMLFLVLERAQ